MVQDIKSSVEDYDSNYRIPWKCTSSNVIMLFLKLFEYLSFLAFIFDTDIKWKES